MYKIKKPRSIFPAFVCFIRTPQQSDFIVQLYRLFFFIPPKPEQAALWEVDRLDNCSMIKFVWLLPFFASQTLLYGFDPRDGTETARRLACIGVRFMLPEASCCTTAGRGRPFLGFDVRGFEVGKRSIVCSLEPPNFEPPNPRPQCDLCVLFSTAGGLKNSANLRVYSVTPRLKKRY